jgi:NTE family protein
MPDTAQPRTRVPEAGHRENGRRTVLVLQGGGALGSYQAGVFEGLAESGRDPDWVAGVSIGAINASIIAGNPPGRRVERLHAFWEKITAPSALWSSMVPGWHGVEKKLGAAWALMFGQPGFFRPRPPYAWLGDDQPISVYDTSELHSTLEELVDFDRINARHMRLSVGAVEVATGNMIYFDSTRTKIRPEHVMASGALPPGLAMIEIDGRGFWDGGLVSNTPLQYVMEDKPRQESVIFQVDLFPARGRLPTNMDEVAEREKDIRYSSRTRTGTQVAREMQNRRRLAHSFLQSLPPELANHPLAVELREFACPAQVDVVHLIYYPTEPQGAQKDYQFDRSTMLSRWQLGLKDAQRTMQAAPWRAPHPPNAGLRTFDLTTPASNR